MTQRLLPGLVEIYSTPHSGEYAPVLFKWNEQSVLEIVEVLGTRYASASAAFDTATNYLRIQREREEAKAKKLAEAAPAMVKLLEDAHGDLANYGYVGGHLAAKISIFLNDLKETK